MSLYKKDLICTQDWSKSELISVLKLAAAMKRNPFADEWTKILKNKSFLMLFYNQSLRTHLSFETAATQLGGHAQYRKHDMGWIKTATKAGESIKDAAKVISRYVDGIGIRITLDAISHYGEGYNTLLEYAKWGDAPVINMADDRFHPCQALADIQAWSEWHSENREFNLGNLKGKKLLLTWAKSGLARPWAAVQSHLLLASRFGMNITLAHPNGYDLDSEVYQWIKQNCEDNSTNFEIINNPENGYNGAHVVYVRNWISPDAYKAGLE